MKTILKYIIIVSVIAFAVWLILIAVNDGRASVDPQAEMQSISVLESNDVIGEIEVVQDIETASHESSDPDSDQVEPDLVGTLHIRDKTFTIRDNVAAQTLKNSIGWLNNSSLPPERGPCVLMGHRNTQFRVLKDVEIGEQLIFENISGEQYTYEIKSVEILESDSAMRFYASEDSTLVLVTCYPFYYSGHAPQKYVVTAVIV